MNGVVHAGKMKPGTIMAFPTIAKMGERRWMGAMQSTDTIKALPGRLHRKIHDDLGGAASASGAIRGTGTAAGDFGVYSPTHALPSEFWVLLFWVLAPVMLSYWRVGR